MKNLKSKTISGVFWSASTQVFRQSFSFITTIFLVRLLDPEAFGMLGMVTVLTGFASIFVDVGFGSALIQKRKVSQLELSSVFWFNIFVGALLSAIFFMIAPFVARFYEQPLLLPLTKILSLNFIIGSLGTVQKTVLTKSIDFKSPFKIQMYVQPTAALVTIGLAFLGWGVWALALQLLLTNLLTTGALWIGSKWRPSAIFSWDSLKSMFGYSLNILGNDTLNYWVRNVDNLLIGRFIGTAELGIYSKSYGILTLPLRNISRVVSRVLFPSLARIQDQKEKVKTVYLKIIRTISLVSFPLMVGLFVVSDRFVPLVYGSQWISMIPLVKVFCVLGMFQSVGHAISNLYLSQGRADLMFRIGTAIRALLVLSIVIGLQGGILGVAISYTVVSILASFVDHYFAARLVNLSISEILGYLRGAFITSVVMGIVMEIISLLSQTYLSDPGVVLLQSGVGAITYLAILHTFRVEAYTEVLELWKERQSKKPAVNLRKVA